MEKKKGSCHCKTVTYEAEVDLTQPVLECNCSHCARKGFLLAFVPEEKFKLLSGKDNLMEYRFNRKAIQHLFCKTCGVQCFGHGEQDGKKMVAINTRTLDDVDLTKLVKQPFDGQAY